MNKYFTAFSITLILAGCSKGEPTYTVEQFKADKAKREATLVACKNNPGEKAMMPNCINADQADTEILSARRGYSPLEPLKKGE